MFFLLRIYLIIFDMIRNAFFLIVNFLRNLCSHEGVLEVFTFITILVSA